MFYPDGVTSVSCIGYVYNVLPLESNNECNLEAEAAGTTSKPVALSQKPFPEKGKCILPRTYLLYLTEIGETWAGSSFYTENHLP